MRVAADENTRDAREAPSDGSRVVPLALLAAALAIVVTTAWRTRALFMDDAWTGFRYVENLLSGNGFVFQPGERVEGVTNTGWLLLLSVPSMVFDVATVAKILGLLLCLLTLILCYVLGQDLLGGPKAALLAAPAVLIAATQFDFVYYSLAGMETGLIAALSCALVFAAASDRRLWLLPLLGAGAFLVRPEALLVYPLFLVIVAAARLDPPKRLLTGAGIFVALILSITAVRYAYFGALLPNTFGGKPTTPTEALVAVYASLAGKNPNLSVLFSGFAPLLVMALGIVLLSRRAASPADRARAAMIAAAVATGWIFATYAPVDWTLTGRYFGPWLPLSALALWAGVLEVGAWLFSGAGATERGRQHAALLAIPLVAVTSLNLSAKTAPDWINSYPGYVITSRNLIEPCRWMNEHLPPETTVATRRIGALGYFTGRDIFDYSWGLITPEVTPLVRAHGEPFEDPNDPALAQVWRSERPEFLLEDWDDVEAFIESAEGTPDRFELHGVPYRVARKFAIGDEAWWALCARADIPLSWSESEE